jgi:hypothetical protein
LDGLDDAFDTDPSSPDPQRSNQPVQDENGDVATGGDRDWRDVASSTFPIEWLDFHAELAGTDAHLDWATLREENMDYFDVQRSLDGQIYETKGRVPARGDTESVSEYAWVDEGVTGLPVKLVYYRLRQMEASGEFSFSATIEVAISGTHRLGLKVFPNPTRDLLEISWSSLPTQEAGTLTLLNSAGQTVREAKILPTQTRLSWGVQELPGGIYHLQLRQLGQSETISFIKK